MTIATEIRRALGTMIVYGYPRGDLAVDLAIARRLGAEVVEILPHWPTYPDPGPLRDQVAAAGLTIHSAHGCWGGHAIQAARVDLSHPDPATRSASLDDLKRCVDWLQSAGGRCLVVHPGGLSDSDEQLARADALSGGLVALADHATGTGITICVENMPTGVHPGSRMADLTAILATLDRPELALALDTGHSHISADVATETIAAGRWLGTTHVHDNDGRRDSHLPPGQGSLDWSRWLESLDAIGYRGPIVLECIRHLREVPSSLDDGLLVLLRRLTRTDRS